MWFLCNTMITFLEMYPRELKIYDCIKTYTRIFIAAIFLIAPNQIMIKTKCHVIVSSGTENHVMKFNISSENWKWMSCGKHYVTIVILLRNLLIGKYLTLPFCKLFYDLYSSFVPPPWSGWYFVVVFFDSFFSLLFICSRFLLCGNHESRVSTLRFLYFKLVIIWLCTQNPSFILPLNTFYTIVVLCFCVL